MLTRRARWSEWRLNTVRPTTIFALAFAVRAVGLFAFRYYESDLDLDSEISHLAAQLAENFNFANPYTCVTGPTAHAPPAFPLILSLLYRLFEAGPVRETVICLVGSAVSSLIYALLPRFAVSLGFQRAAGVCAGLFGALVPQFFWIEARGIWDAPYVCLFLVLCTAATLELRPGASLRRIAGVGALWGIAFWVAPSLLPVLLVCSLILFWRYLPSPQAIAVVCALGVPAIAVVSPWIVRNYVQFHSVFWMRDNFGLELHTSNNPEARPIEADNREHTNSFQVHPNGHPAACAKVQQVGELLYFKTQQRLAMEWIRSQPGAFVKLSLDRAYYFWFLPLPSLPKRLASAVLTVLAFVALALMWRTAAARLLLLILFTYSALYYAIQVDPRFRYPLHPLILVAVSAGTLSAIATLRRKRAPDWPKSTTAAQP